MEDEDGDRNIVHRILDKHDLLEYMRAYRRALACLRKLFKDRKPIPTVEMCLLLRRGTEADLMKALQEEEYGVSEFNWCSCYCPHAWNNPVVYSSAPSSAGLPYFRHHSFFLTCVYLQTLEIVQGTERPDEEELNEVYKLAVTKGITQEGAAPLPREENTDVAISRNVFDSWLFGATWGRMCQDFLTFSPVVKLTEAAELKLARKVNKSKGE